MSPNQIIEMQPSDEGAFSYTPGLPPKRSGRFLAKVFGIALGVALFLLALVFFVYVVIPIILILIALYFLRRLFNLFIH